MCRHRAAAGNQLLELARHQAVIELQDDVESIALLEARLDLIVDEVRFGRRTQVRSLRCSMNAGFEWPSTTACRCDERVRGGERNSRQTEENRAESRALEFLNALLPSSRLREGVPGPVSQVGRSLTESKGLQRVRPSPREIELHDLFVPSPAQRRGDDRPVCIPGCADRCAHRAATSSRKYADRYPRTNTTRWQRAGPYGQRAEK